MQSGGAPRLVGSVLEVRNLALHGNGKFTAGRQSGCWDADGKQILFRFACINYGNRDVYLPIAEPSKRCTFGFGERLSLKDCSFVGQYRRENGS